MELDPKSEEAAITLAKVEAVLAASCLRHELMGHVGHVHCMAFLMEVNN